LAVRHGHSKLVDLLLESSSFVNAVDYFGNSVFFYAVESGNPELVFVS
jgi:ankyrin repeat protein